MKVISRKKDHWVIALEGVEQLKTVVEAWARASFEMAKPAGISAITSYDPAKQWQHVRVEAMTAHLSPADPSCVLAMDYVAGRRCKTTIRQGRKYLRVFPGDEREQEIETMYLLAMKYLAEKTEDFNRVIPQTDSIQ